VIIISGRHFTSKLRSSLPKYLREILLRSFTKVDNISIHKYTDAGGAASLSYFI